MAFYSVVFVDNNIVSDSVGLVTQRMLFITHGNCNIITEILLVISYTTSYCKN